MANLIKTQNFGGYLFHPSKNIYISTRQKICKLTSADTHFKNSPINKVKLSSAVKEHPVFAFAFLCIPHHFSDSLL